jgi:oligopeptide transport system permease protein
MNGKTLAYIVKRILLAVVTIFVVVSLTFWFMQLIPRRAFYQRKDALRGDLPSPFGQVRTR